MATILHGYDVAHHLRSPAEMAAYLEASIIAGDGDAAFVAQALGDIARRMTSAEVRFVWLALARRISTISNH